MLRDQLDAAMLELQGAMSASALYESDHQSATAKLDSAWREFMQVLARRENVTVTCLGDHVICADMRLPSSDLLSTGLFHRLSSLGYECISITKGVQREEFAKLVSFLNATDSVGADDAWETACIRLGAIDHSATSGPANSDIAHSATERGQTLDPMPLQQLWTGVSRERNLERSSLEGIVGGICETVDRGSDTLLPLAALKRFDEYTFIHTINVALLSAALAEAAGLSSDLIADITAAALLHDIGKQAIPAAILNKKGGLTDAERDVMKRHAIEGAVILFDTPGVPNAAPIIAFEHHMHRDGTGYPNQPPGWKLSLASQLVQVADIFDALRTHRPYREALSLEKAREIMSDMPLDPDLAALFFDRVARRTDRELEAELGIENTAA